MRTIFADEIEVLDEEIVGRYRVQLFLSSDESPVYRILVEVSPEWWQRAMGFTSGGWRKVACTTDADERAFPKTVGLRGEAMVKEYLAKLNRTHDETLATGSLQLPLIGADESQRAD